MLRRAKGYINFLLENSLFLIIGTFAGLVWANVHFASYERVAHQLHFVINDVGMVFFFAIAAKEVFESILPDGALSSPRKAAMPLLATIGGMIGPAAIFIVGAHMMNRSDLAVGWAIPCATDIAFSYLVARFVFGSKHPAIPFLLLLAIADDGLGLMILTLFYHTGQGSVLILAGLVLVAIVISLLMKRAGLSNFWPYVTICGGVSWLGFYYGGIHPALAMVPVIFAMPHEKADLGMFAEEKENLSDTLNKFEHWWETPVEIILGLFGFVNGGVIIGSAGIGTWLVLIALMLGKPIGILLFSLIGRLFGFKLPDGMRWADVIVLGCAAAVGFTVSLFISTVAFPLGKDLDMMKIGALLSFGAIVITFIVGKLLKVEPVRG